jgi:hypothetical protein
MMADQLWDGKTGVLRAWEICVFKNFNGNDLSWVSACGKHAPYQINTHIMYFMFVCFSGQGVLFSIIFLPDLMAPSQWLAKPREIIFNFMGSWKVGRNEEEHYHRPKYSTSK